jgi:hypothetical protein
MYQYLQVHTSTGIIYWNYIHRVSGVPTPPGGDNETPCDSPAGSSTVAAQPDHNSFIEWNTCTRAGNQTVNTIWQNLPQKPVAGPWVHASDPLQQPGLNRPWRGHRCSGQRPVMMTRTTESPTRTAPSRQSAAARLSPPRPGGGLPPPAAAAKLDRGGGARGRPRGAPPDLLRRWAVTGVRSVTRLRSTRSPSHSSPPPASLISAAPEADDSELPPCSALFRPGRTRAGGRTAVTVRRRRGKAWARRGGPARAPRPLSLGRGGQRPSLASGLSLSPGRRFKFTVKFKFILNRRLTRSSTSRGTRPGGLGLIGLAAHSVRQLPHCQSR